MRPAPGPRLLFVVVAALACTSCALSTERPEERATTWARAYLDARCRYHVRCEPSLGIFAEREQVVCHPESWLADLEERAARVGDTFSFDEVRAMRCLAAIEDAPCRVAPGTPYDDEILGCEDVIAGTVPEGGACDPTLGGRCLEPAPCPGECADRGTCVAEGGACGGVCRGPALRGESCIARLCVEGTECWLGTDAEPRCRAVDLEPGAGCVADDRCLAVDGHPHRCLDGRCAPIPVVGVGEACGVLALCESSAVCRVGGVCVMRVGAGEPCGATEECVDGHRCDTTTSPDGRCVALEPGECRNQADCPATAPYCVVSDRGWRCSPDATGQPCTGSPFGALPFHVEDPCPDTHRCHVLGSAARRCAPIVAEGAACDSEHACPDGTRCESDRCVRIAGPGEACGPARVCPLTERCIDGACSPLPALGEPCTGECFEGGCESGRCVLMSAGATCDHQLALVVPQCLDRCLVGECRGTVSDVGEPCGLARGSCAHGLHCIAQLDGSGLCAAECSE